MRMLPLKTLATLTVLFCVTVCLGQTSKDYFNRDLQNTQRKTVKAVLFALEIGTIEKAAQLFETSDEALEDQLQYLSKEIAKVKDSCRLSIVTVFEPGFNIYRCRYYNDSGELFQMDFYLKEGEPNSKIQKAESMDAAVLKAEYDLRMRQINSIPPPPPLPERD